MISWFREHINEFDFIMQQVNQVSEISRQAYHQQLKRDCSTGALHNHILELVREKRISHPRSGARKLFKMLDLQGQIGINQFESLISEKGLGVPIKRSAYKTTNSNHPLFKYVNLLNGYKLTGVNQVWATDITYFILGGKVYYITFIMDVYSRRILGYTASESMGHANNLKVLQQSIKMRDSKGLDKLIHHSDKGSQFCSNAYIKLLESNNIFISMAGTSLENAYVERLNGILKNDYLYPRNKVYDLKSLNKELKEIVRLYNQERPHSELGNLTPVRFEEKLKANPISMKIAMELFDFEQNENDRFFKAYAIRMNQGGERALAESTASLLHSNWSGYSLESCSSAELSSASPDWANICEMKIENGKSFQHRINNV